MVFDSLMKEIKKFCKDDDNCVLVILVLTGFLLCMFFNRSEGFTLDEIAAPIQGKDETPGPSLDSGLPQAKGPTVESDTEEILGIKPEPMVPQNGYGSLGNNIDQLKKQPVPGVMSGQVQKEKLTKVPTGFLQLPAVTGYPFTEFMGRGLPSKWPQDRPIGKAPTPIDTPGPTKGPPVPADGPAQAPGPVQAPGDKKVMTLVLFYAPWCGHSKNMLEDYEAVISEYNGQTKDGVTYEVIKIDMEKDKDAAKRYKVEVKGFPTLYTFYTVGDKQIANIFPYRTKNEIIEELVKRGQAMN